MFWLGIGCDGGIVVVVMVRASLRVLVVTSSNVFNCMFCGSVNSGWGGSLLAHHFHHYRYHQGVYGVDGIVIVVMGMKAVIMVAAA